MPIWTSALFGAVVLSVRACDLRTERFLNALDRASSRCAWRWRLAAPSKSASLHIDPALEALVPSDTVFVAGANLDAIRDTAVYQKLLSRAFRCRSSTSFTRQTGLDPRKDLSQILAVLERQARGLLMVRGKFQPQRPGSAPEIEQGVKPGPPTKSTAVRQRTSRPSTFLNDSTAAAGPPRSSCARSLDEPQHRGLPPALRDLLRTLPARRSGLCGAHRRRSEKLNLPLPRERQSREHHAGSAVGG